MQAIVSWFVSWPELFLTGFTEHPLAATVVSVAAMGIAVVLQQELRPYRLFSNLAIVTAGWLLSMLVLVYVMAGLRHAWIAVEGALPLAAKLASYFYGICERHPILALAVVGAGTTAYFLRRPWPAVLSWGPVRALSAALGAALLIHISGPIADIIDGEVAAAPQRAEVQTKEKLPQIAPQEAVAHALQHGDNRYLSVRQCIDRVAGYPVAESGKPDMPSPLSVGVKAFGGSCYESLGQEGALRARREHDYAAEYNRLMYEHNRRNDVRVDEAVSPAPSPS